MDCRRHGEVLVKGSRNDDHKDLDIYSAPENKDHLEDFYMVPVINYLFEGSDNQQKKNKMDDGIHCKICGAIFKSKFNLQKHNERYEDYQDHRKCSICTKTLKDENEMVQHIYKAHQDPDSYQCNICNKKFSTPGYLSNHKKMHNKLHKCLVCGQGFQQKNQLLDHQWRHDGVKRHKCENCTQSFATKGSLKTHSKMCSYLMCRKKEKV